MTGHPPAGPSAGGGAAPGEVPRGAGPGNGWPSEQMSGDETWSDLDAPLSSGDPGRWTEAEGVASIAHMAMSGSAVIPERLRSRVVAEGEAIVRAGLADAGGARRSGVRGGGRAWVTGLLAACLVMSLGAAGLLGMLYGRRVQELDDLATRLAQARAQVEVNARLVAEAEGRAADAARRLAAATSDLDLMNERIALLTGELPSDELASLRQELIHMPGSIRLTWEPFDLANAPAVQPGVKGDVVWNEEAQEGYLRFTGLEVNDPSEMVYQLWVIDDRGMEQKISGGVFNASRDGEVIVRFNPSLEIHRVRLFAVTVEPPRGVAVPDLRRPLVFAPVPEQAGS